MSKETKENKKLFKILSIEMPHTLLIVFIILTLAAILTFVIPSGEYLTITLENGSTQLDPNSFQFVEDKNVSISEYFNALPMGLSKMASLIIFLFVAGGTFSVISETNSLEIAINKLANKLQGKEKAMIFIIMLIFSLLGGFVGFNTECIIFIPLGVALARRVGYDAIVGVAMIMCGAYIGNTTGMFNPYATAVAQGIVGLPIYSGAWFRGIMHAVILVAGAIYVIRYGEMVRKDPTKSYCYELEASASEIKDGGYTTDAFFTMRNKLVIIAMIAAFLLIIYGCVSDWGWGTSEMAPVFIALTIASGVIGGLDGNKICVAFIAGAKSMMFACLVIGLGRGILYVMECGGIFHTVLYGMANVLQQLPSMLVAEGMFVANIIINFFVPSGSGQASLVMPIMGPLASLVGLTPQTAVIAFQTAAGFSDIAIPTSSTTNACISSINLPFAKWFKFSIRLALIEWTLSIVFVAIAAAIQIA